MGSLVEHVARHVWHVDSGGINTLKQADAVLKALDFRKKIWQKSLFFIIDDVVNVIDDVINCQSDIYESYIYIYIYSYI